MKKRLRLLLVSLVAFSGWFGVAGCSNSGAPTKTTIEKLDSDKPDEQKEGLDEANQKYGGNP